ncbi:MAG TPA: hypothetical protein EYQ00_10900 [Dehalococcoidia bacterium]|nr:hypothetical protein [Dehalococcoidia bacterium]
MNKTFTFTLEIQGEGTTQEEAWQDALDSFFSEPGEPLEVQEEEQSSLFGEIDKDTESFDFSEDDAY